MKSIRVGNGAGFWGDNLDAPRRLCEAGRLDYLTLEYLAELTMSILAHQKSRDPSAGWVTDFGEVIASLVPSLRAQPGLKIVTNAGGMNPRGCAAAIADVLVQQGLPDIVIGAVSGDNLFPRLDELLRAGESFAHFETGQPIDSIRNRIVSANAYLGAGGIVESLAGGARIVMTGRVADASLTLGPAVYELGWNWLDWAQRDWDRLAAATVAGHLIECGAQCTGGMFSAWRPEISLSDVGYPIAEISDDGRVIITKPPESGGTVNVETVAEQLVYEIGDPTHYLTPDVDTDFSHVRLSQVGIDRVEVSHARGAPPPETLKVSLAYQDGFMAAATLVVCGPNAVENARAAAAMILDGLASAGVRLARTHVEILGNGDTLPGLAMSPASDPWDVVLRVSAADPSRAALERFVREFAPLVTAGPPGITGYTGGRAKPHPVLAYWPTTVSRAQLNPEVVMRTAKEWASTGGKSK
jgi:hypothetical protein